MFDEANLKHLMKLRKLMHRMQWSNHVIEYAGFRVVGSKIQRGRFEVLVDRRGLRWCRVNGIERVVDSGGDSLVSRLRV